MTKKEPKKVKKLAIIPNKAAFSSDALQKSITQFEKSSRFELLKTFSLSKTIQLPVNSKNKDISFGEFTQIGAKTFLTKYKPAKEVLERLLVFLKESSDAESTESPAPEKHQQSFDEIHNKKPFKLEGLPSVDIINARQILTNAINKLRACEHFPTLQDRTLEQFWDTTWPRAPFEEALTLKQISELNVDSLLKKRSLVPAKIAAICGAINKAIRDKGIKANISATTEPTQPSVTQKGASSWSDSDLLGMPTYARGILSFYDQQVALCSSQSIFLQKILITLPHYLSAKDFLILWFANEHKPEVIAGMLTSDENEIVSRLLAARYQTALCIKENTPAMLAHWQSLLSSPGIKVDTLSDFQNHSALDKDFVTVLLSLMLASCGAVHPRIQDLEFCDLWTMNEEAANCAFDLVCASLPLSNFEVKRHFKILLPYFDQARLIVALSAFAELDNTDRWSMRCP